MKVIIAVATSLVLANFGCRKELKASVECQATADSFACTVAHLSGDEKAKTCWAIKLGCSNGTTVIGNLARSYPPEQKQPPLFLNLIYLT